MMLDLLRFEWRFHLRQRTTWAAIGLLSMFCVALVSSNYGERNLFLNGPFTIWTSLSLPMLLSIFVSAVVSSNAVLRDDDSKMSEIIFATPTSAQRLLWVRFAGVWTVMVAVYAIAVSVLMVAPFVLPVSADRLGPLHVEYYLSAMLTLVIPTITVVTAALFAVALVTRSTLATMVAGIVLYAAYMMIASVTGSPLMAASKPQTAAAMTVAALVDPFGISAYYQQTRYWTPDLRNTQVISLTGSYLANRGIWLVIAGVIVALVGKVGLRRRESAARGKRVKHRAPSSTTAPHDIHAGHSSATLGYTSALVGQVRGVLAFRAARSVARMDTRFLLISWPAIVMLVIWGALITTELLSATLRIEYGTQLIRTSAILVEAAQQPLMLFGTVVLIFFGPEVVWRARGAHMDELLDATPAGNGVRYAGHFAALSSLIVVITVVAITIAVIVQLVQGDAPVEWAVYGSLFVTVVWPLILFIVMVLFIQALSANRYVGMLGALAMALAQQVWTPFGIDHPMLRYAAAPPMGYSDVAGFGIVAQSYVAFMVFWSVVAALLMLLSLALWHRGHPTTLWTRLHALRVRSPLTPTITAAAALTVVVGALLAYNTISHGRYTTPKRSQDWRAAYEKAYGSRIPITPTIRAIAATVNLYPHESRYTIAGAYTVFNETSVSVDTIWLAVRQESDSVVATVNGAPAVWVDSTFGMRAFVPATPLAGGDSAVIAFSFVRDASGVRAGFDASEVGPKSTFLDLRRILPSVGYRLSYVLTDNRLRSTYGLAPIDTSEIYPQEMIRAFDMTITTSADQIPIASGTMVSEWSDSNRRGRTYQLTGPVPNILDVASGPYDVSRGTQGGVAIEMYHLPTHLENVPRMLRAAERSLAYMTARFSPYPHGVLRIVEVSSSFGGAAFATPGTIYFAEDRGFLTRAPEADGLDLVARRTAHEVAHQWWGHQLAPARAPGNLLMVESFAKYIEQRIVADIQDEARASLIRAYDHDRYLQGRTRAEGQEPSMVTMGGDDYLYYGKGAIVLAAVRDLVGEAHLEHTMRSLLPAYDSSASVPTAPEFLRRLEHGLSQHDSTLVHEWLAAVTLYDLAIDSAVVQSTPGGSSNVLRVFVTAEKFVRNGDNEHAAPMDEMIELSVMSDMPDTDGTRIRYDGRHRITSGVNVLELSVLSLEPGNRVTIDPAFLRIDRERTNNSVRVTGR